MSLDASATTQPDLSLYQTDFAFPDSDEQSKTWNEPNGLVREALQLPSAKESTMSETAVTVPENHGDGMGNVMNHLAIGVGNEIVEHPGALAGNAALGFGIGYATKVGLASQFWRKPTIAGLAVAGGLAAIDLISSAPGWMKSIDIASDTSGKSLEEVTAAEKHLQSMGGGVLELAVGGATGGLAFKPSVAAATESMLTRSRAAIFGGAEKSVIGQPRDVAAVRFGKGDHEALATENAEALASVYAKAKDMPLGKVYSDSQGRATFLQRDDGYVEIYQYTDAGATPSHVRLVEKGGMPVVAKFSEEGVRIPLANGEEALWKGTFNKGEWVKAADEKFADPRSVFMQANESAGREPAWFNVNENDEVVLAENLARPVVAKANEFSDAQGLSLSTKTMFDDIAVKAVGRFSKIVETPSGKLHFDDHDRVTFAARENGFLEAFSYKDDSLAPYSMKIGHKHREGGSAVGTFSDNGVHISTPFRNDFWKGTFENGQWVKAVDEDYANPIAIVEHQSSLFSKRADPNYDLFSLRDHVNPPKPYNKDLPAGTADSSVGPHLRENGDGTVSIYRGNESMPSDVIAGKADDIVSITDYLQKQSLRAAQLVESGAQRDAQMSAATRFIQSIEAKQMNPQYVDPGLTHFSQSTGFLSSNRVKTTFGNSSQYYKWEGGKLTELIGTRRGDSDPITVKVRNKEYFVSAADGTEVQWKGSMSPNGIFYKAPEENFATPFEMGRALPQVRHAEAFENGKNYAAEIDKLITNKDAREHFSADNPRRLLFMRDGAGDNYFRYDQNGNMIGWTFKPDNKMAAFELNVTPEGILIPHPDGDEILWRGKFKNGVWWKHATEKIQQPLSMVSHLYSGHLPA